MTVVIDGITYAVTDPDLSAAEVEDLERIMAETGCLFPDSHCPQHGKDYRFSVLFWQEPDARWEELTEAEIIEAQCAMGPNHGHFLHTSDWDFWCEDIHPEGRHPEA